LQKQEAAPENDRLKIGEMFSRKPKLTFAKTTKVRNQYENAATGQVTLNEYNVNATGNNNMPGYAKTSKHFRPHSKSKIQQEYNPGLGPAVSSVGDPVKRVAQSEAERELIRNIYGNAWINAEVILNEAERASMPLHNEANTNYQNKLSKLEADFFKNTGHKAPTELIRNKQTLNGLPEGPRQEFEKSHNVLKRNLAMKRSNANAKYSAIESQAVIKTPYRTTTRKTLSQRLRAAEAARAKALPWYSLGLPALVSAKRK